MGVSPVDFLTRYSFRYPQPRSRGLESGLSLHHLPEIFRGLGAARLVSTPSFLTKAWLGIAI